MTEQSRDQAHDLARQHLARGDHQGWFEALYRSAGGDSSIVPWADLRPSPLMLQLLDGPLSGLSGRCAVVGCGLGDDAQELARRGFEVTAFDLSHTAIAWCRERWQNTEVDFRQADLLELPADMPGSFDLVMEINTLQAVPDALRLRMLAPLASLLAEGGQLAVICRMCHEGELIDGPPWAVTRSELDLLSADHGLENVLLEQLSDGEDPPKRRFVALFRRNAG